MRQVCREIKSRVNSVYCVLILEEKFAIAKVVFCCGWGEKALVLNKKSTFWGKFAKDSDLCFLQNWKTEAKIISAGLIFFFGEILKNRDVVEIGSAKSEIQKKQSNVQKK